MQISEGVSGVVEALKFSMPVNTDAQEPRLAVSCRPTGEEEVDKNCMVVDWRWELEIHARIHRPDAHGCGTGHRIIVFTKRARWQVFVATKPSVMRSLLVAATKLLLVNSRIQRERSKSGSVRSRSCSCSCWQDEVMTMRCPLGPQSLTKQGTDPPYWLGSVSAVNHSYCMRLLRSIGRQTWVSVVHSGSNVVTGTKIVLFVDLPSISLHTSIISNIQLYSRFSK
jgi:hypothetical protein